MRQRTGADAEKRAQPEPTGRESAEGQTYACNEPGATHSTRLVLPALSQV
mgnify:CR=1 FL=1